MYNDNPQIYSHSVSTASTCKQTWCAKIGSMTLNTGTMPYPMFYTSGQSALNQPFSTPFSFSDPTCEAKLLYSMSNTITPISSAS